MANHFLVYETWPFEEDRHLGIYSTYNDAKDAAKAALIPDNPDIEIEEWEDGELKSRIRYPNNQIYRAEPKPGA